LFLQYVIPQEVVRVYYGRRYVVDPGSYVMLTVYTYYSTLYGYIILTACNEGNPIYECDIFFVVFVYYR
jgi:hypothetical protein